MVDKKNYDFKGWATRNDIQCSDGRTIKQNAFKDQDGTIVPLVWNHGHSEVNNVLGHALLENRSAGVYCYCSFNNTSAGQEAKELVQHGDISSLSIYANKLKQQGKDVLHGMIREVSLVLAGANPGAYIEDIVSHDEEEGLCAQIYHTADGLKFIDDPDDELEHACGDSDDEKKKKELEHAKEQENVEIKDVAEEGNKNETIADVFNTLSDKQKKVVYFMLGQAMEGNSEENAKHSEELNNEEDKTVMKENVFDKKSATNEVKHNYFTKEEEKQMLEEARRTGASLKDVVLAHSDFVDEDNNECQKEVALAHSITNITNLYPEVQAVNKTPKVVERRKEWVSVVLNAIHKVPFTKIKSTSIDITADEARAKGYVTGNQKVEEVIVAAKRTTEPTTIYKLQKLDRDYILDITDFDVVRFLKDEMSGMIDEEFARAILIGDQRSALSNDKIDPSKIRPILGDNSLYTIAKVMQKAEGDNEYTFAKNWIRTVIKNRKEYKGAGSPIMFVTEDLLSDCLLIEDTNGRCIYESVEALATKLRVKQIVSVPVFEGVTRAGTGADTGYNFNLMAIMVDLSDYTSGTNKGGEKTFFEDFDINYNKYAYLGEERHVGALTTPLSAITYEEKVLAPEQVEG